MYEPRWEALELTEAVRRGCCNAAYKLCAECFITARLFDKLFDRIEKLEDAARGESDESLQNGG